MVCLSDVVSTQVVVKDMTDQCNVKPFNIALYPSMTVESIFNTISYHYKVDTSVVLTLQNNFAETWVLNQYMDKKLYEIRDLNIEQKSTILVSLVKKKNMKLCVQASPEDDLLLGASASPTTGEMPVSTVTPSSESLMSGSEQDCSYNRARSGQSSSDACNYVGLVNQAMTCYLNSLLQALYMTPEFRNALYNWEFDGSNPGNSIPFQLQRLFLNLQTSSKSAVETTDLTHSFGWNMQQAWEQHDIQELCRVMFDALEQKFKDTKQANLINDLYEGKMLDYVKCLECSTEKSREDTFQDIPLPVRPFGSCVAYNSVEEALRAFVQPETLEGNNQYHCEKCNKKCDAHKGLKFTKFPYLLTLHLKRFDFDYSTITRIKLNDKVVFPEKLNLNSFIPTSSEMNNGSSEETMEDRETVVKCDDCSTTDSGSALDDESCQGTDVSSMANEHISSECPDDDEGIDVSSGNNENEKNRLQEPKGPYIYELFSIMIHSGSASGGHYYAYIKDFSKNQWFCFNDQIVTRVTEDDIHKTYGGGPQRGYYSGAYTSSTNAYMLMYRQIDKERNCQAYTAGEFPPHIKQLLLDMICKEENDRLRKEKENDTFKIKMFCNISNQIVDAKMLVFGDTMLSEATSDAHSKFKLEDTVRLEDCRLVIYSKSTESIVYSIEEDCRFSEISPKYTEFFLDIKKPDEEFEEYKMGGVSMRAYLINLEMEQVDSPRNVWVNPEWTVQDLKAKLSSMFKIEVLHVVQEAYSNQPKYLETNDLPLKFEPRCNGYKLYVSNMMDPDPEKPFTESKLAAIIDQFVHVIMLEVSLPDTELGTLELLSIPALDMNQNCDRSVEIGAGDRNSADLRISPQPGNCELLADQSNSEDSSLSDSDRTLVGDAPGDNIGLLSSSSNSPADQHMASPSDLARDLDLYDKSFSYSQPQVNRHDMDMMWDEDEAPHLFRNNYSNQNYYFKAQVIEKPDPENPNAMTKSCHIQIDKRTSLGRLKKHLEPIIGVPMEYFKIFRQYHNQDIECSTLTDTLSSIKDGDRLLVKLGRVLKSNEVSGKIHFLQLNNNPELVTFWFEWIIAKDQTVASVKKEILHQAKKQYMIDMPLSKCRLRKKHVKAPARVFLDDEKIGDDIIISNYFELYIQEITGAEKTNSQQILVFVRRWNPESLTLSDFEEVVLEENGRTVDELKRKISEVSDIPFEFVEIAHIKSNFPCDMNVLVIHSKLDWNLEVHSLETYPMNIYDDGGIFYYRDSRQTLKELSMEERKELNKNENKRLGRFSSKMYSPRRERGLKIYVDTSPKREDEAFLDLEPRTSKYK